MHFFDYIISHYGWQGTALAACILVLFAVQLYYYIIVYGRISRFRNSRRKKILESEPPISVVVPLFSEDYRYLEESLPLILGQQYGATFEVVLVYVGASNDFYEELARMRLVYPNLTITKIEYNPRFPISVKMALNVGIKSAHNEHIIISTTSAQPATEQWLAMMGKAFMRGSIVLGYTAIEQKPGLKNYLMRMSRMQMSMYWMAQSVNHNTYRGSRNNFGFTKTIYFGTKGFSHLSMNIGEEDLFIQKIAKRNNVSTVLIPKATMLEHPWGGWRWWIAQLRHYGEAYKLYPIEIRNTIEWELGSQTLFFLAILAALIIMPLEFKLAALLLLILRYIIVMLRAHSIAKRVGEKGVMLRYWIFDIFNPLLMLCVRVAMIRKDSTVWR
ncbi:MAG: glycosyltransferase [Alistipes sp.]|nr:glycosyltransferase [Alistipes sp.]